MALSAKLFEGMLDRNKPLWEIYMVEGLEGPRSAMVSRVHHCLVDGVSGIELLMIVLDVSPNSGTAAARRRTRSRVRQSRPRLRVLWTRSSTT